jgi:hypothetical protein
MGIIKLFPAILTSRLDKGKTIKFFYSVGITADGSWSMGAGGWGGSVTGYVCECAVNNEST